jgi:HAD superfamily hydrolase (TIGR01509 family)
MRDAVELSRDPAASTRPPRPAIDAVVFDLDGVICDTERAIHDLWLEVFARYGCSFTSEEWSSVIGTDSAEFEPFEALVARATLALPAPEELRSSIELELEQAVCELPPLPGVVEWMDEAEELGLPIGVASSSPRAWVEARLAGTGLDERVRVVSCCDEHLRAKPAPDVYLDACARLGVEPGRALAIEDSMHGVTAAKKAGMLCVAVRNADQHRLDLSGADLVLSSLAELDLAAALRSLGAG